jgi:molecular chaperone GrpE
VTQPAADPDVTLEVLAGEIADLRDLFRRRLLSDQVQKRSVEELHKQLEIANERLTAAVLAPLLRQVVLVIDRIERADDTAADGGLVESVHQELLEILARQGAVRMECVGSPFDPNHHHATGTVEVGDPAEDGVVVTTSRAGYLLSDRVLRPAEVEVGRFVPRAAEVRPSSEGVPI